MSTKPELFSFYQWPHTHIVHITHANPDGTVTIQRVSGVTANGGIWFGVPQSKLTRVRSTA